MRTPSRFLIGVCGGTCIQPSIKDTDEMDPAPPSILRTNVCPSTSKQFTRWNESTFFAGISSAEINTVRGNSERTRDIAQTICRKYSCEQRYAAAGYPGRPRTGHPEISPSKTGFPGEILTP